MAEFAQTMKDWNRMCRSMVQEDEYTGCDKCDLRSFGCPAIYEKESDDANWNHIESVVTKWVAEHPEPIYPTWGEWLISVGAARKIPTGIPFELQGGSIVDPPWETAVDVNTPIPADIAQKLRLEPKEVI